MKISELQVQLEELKEECGDVPVCANFSGLIREIDRSDLCSYGYCSFMVSESDPRYDAVGGFVKEPHIRIE